MASPNGDHPNGDKPKRGRPRLPASQRRIAPSREKERYAYELWVKGATIAEIAHTTWRDGKPMYGTSQSCQDAVNRAAVYMRPSEDLAELRTQSLAGMEAVKREMWDLLNNNDDPDVRIRAARTLERIDARIGSLMGLDAAIKFEHSGPGGGPIEHNVRVHALMQRADNIVLLPQERIVDAQPPDEVEEA